MQNGWARIHRQIEENPLWLSEPFTRGQAWVDLIIFANHKDSFFYIRGNKVDIKRGQIGWSQITIAKRWKWNRKKVRGFLNMLETGQQITQQKNTLTTVITILNYDKYQSKRTAECPTEGQQKDSRVPTYKNVKKVKNVKKREGDITQDFIREIKEDNKYYFLNIDGELEKWQDWKSANGKRFANNQAAFRNWVRKSREFILERNPEFAKPIKEKSSFTKFINKKREEQNV